MNKPAKIETETLASSMALAFAEIEAATKDATNPHFRSKYADLSSVIGAVKPALVKHGLFFTQHPQPSEDGVIVETVLHHAGGERLSLGSLYVPANKRDAQGFGSAMTYARRYALQTAFGVPTEDDDGNLAVANTIRPTAGEARPESDATKVPGISKIKAKLNKLMLDGDKATDLEAFNALVHDCKAELTVIRDANHQYWTGDGEDFEGFKAWITRRRAGLSGSLQFQMLVSLIDECDTVAALQNLVTQHGDAIDALDGEESRRFQQRFDEREAGLAAVAKVTEGA